MAKSSPQLAAVYQRALVLQQRADELPEAQQALLSAAFKELQAVLEELQTSEEELRDQNQELVNTRRAVEAERQRYQELFEFAPDGYLVTDVNGKIQEANRAALVMLNVSQEFLVGKPLSVFIDHPERYRFDRELDRLQQSEKLQDWEIRLRPYQRSPFDAALTVSSVYNLDGHGGNLRWLLRDITERKQVERLLENLNSQLERQVEERTAQLQQALDFEAGLKRITDKVRDGLDESKILQAAVHELTLVLGLICCDTALYDLSLMTSTIYCEFTNSELEGVVSPSPLGSVISMTSLPENYHQLLQGDYFQFCKLDVDSTRHLAILAHPLSDDQGVLGDLWLFKRPEDVFNELEIRLVKQVANQCAIAIRQARLFQASQAQIDALQKLDQLKDNFLSTTSHELRSPVANIKMAIRMLKVAIAQERSVVEPTLLETAGSPVDRYLRIAEAECDREINLINDLLDLQRLEAGEQPLTLEPIQLQDWLPKIVAPFQERVQEYQQTFQLVLSPDLPLLISNRASLERILAELLTNACKYTPAGGQISVIVQPQLASMQLNVSNTSADVSASELTHIFDKFYRIPKSDPWKQGGTGLGLALVQKLVEHLGGTITVESRSGQLHFKVELPLTQQHQ
ncbi:MAG: PAS domain-containing protein [Phormidesmis sp. CAN_BIN44]|nr:PAS domain-containing protein [Phormidesmis sp. CAN_BIN44]